MKKYFTPEELSQEADNLVRYREELKIMYASQFVNGESKKLFICSDNWYSVEVNGKEVLRSPYEIDVITKFFND
jgi:hypothetical protein